ncbi:TPA: phage gp6-like head-tail connector protein [Yersinia enterocolitica]|nr:phage gp6-like head-tail connector protein [Yersinia enterocolitica]
MLLTLPEIKAQCRLDVDFDHENDLLTLIGTSAEKRVISYTNRKLYADAVPEADPDGLVLEADIKLAMLHLVSHWYENRSSVSDYEQSEVPMSFYFLVGPYRFIPL